MCTWAASDDVYCSGLWHLLLTPEDKICPQNIDIVLVLAKGYAQLINFSLKSVTNRGTSFSIAVDMFSKKSTKKKKTRLIHVLQ